MSCLLEMANCNINIIVILHKDMGDIALSQNGVAKQGIIYESVDIGEIIQVHDYLFANLV